MNYHDFLMNFKSIAFNSINLNQLSLLLNAFLIDYIEFNQFKINCIQFNKFHSI